MVNQKVAACMQLTTASKITIPIVHPKVVGACIKCYIEFLRRSSDADRTIVPHLYNYKD